MSTDDDGAPQQRRLIDAALDQVRGLTVERTEPLPVVPGYTVRRELHRGGQGVVYLGVKRATGQEVAIKLLRDRWHSPRARARFEREVEVLARLRHRNLVAVHDCGTCDGRAFYVMDYVPGRDLDDELRARPRPRRSLVELLARVCEAVAAAHTRGVLHRDLKPSNVRVDDEGEPRLLDFGLAKWLADPDRADSEPPAPAECAPAGGAPTPADGDPTDAASPEETATGAFVGSLPWASPEQVLGRPLDVRSDVYSLGVVLYQALTGAFPYDVTGGTARTFAAIRTTPPPSRRRELGSDLDAILRRALAKEPERRYQSALDLALDLRRWLDGRPIEARRDDLSYVVRKLLRRRWPVALAATIVLAMLTGAAIAVVDSRARWRDAAERLEARHRADRLQNVADALAEGDAAAAEFLLEEAGPGDAPTRTAAPAAAWVERHLRRALTRRRWSFTPTETALAAAWSPDGARVAVGGWDGGLWVLAGDDGTPIWHDATHLTEVRAVAFATTDDLLFALTDDAVAVFAASTGALVRRLPSPRAGLEQMSVAAERILAATPAGEVVALDPTGRDPATWWRAVLGDDRVPRRVSDVRCTAVHADTRRAVTVGGDGVCLWDAGTGSLRHTWSLASDGAGASPSAATFSPDGRQVAVGLQRVGATPAALLVFDAETGARLAAVENLEDSPVALAPGGGDTCWVTVRASARGGAARSIELSTGRVLDRVPGRGGPVRALVPFGGSPRLLLVATSVECWEDAETVGPVMAQRPLALTVGAGGLHCAAAGTRGGLALTAGRGEAGVLIAGPATTVTRAASDSKLARVTFLTRDGDVGLASLAGDELGHWHVESLILDLALDGEDAVVLVRDDRAVVRLDQDGAATRLADAPCQVTALAATADRLFLGSDGAVHVLRRGTDTPPERIALARETVTAMALRAGDDLLAAGTRGGRVWLIDLAHALPLCALPVSGSVRALAWDRALDDLLVLGDDGRVTRLQGKR